jgi:uncharacterized protein GlcG (DUF336 family)
MRRELLLALSCLLLSCGGGGGGGSEDTTGANYGCDGTCTNFNLSDQDVRTIIRRGIGAANSLGVAATFAVTDRVGNVLAVYQMPGANLNSTINGQIGATGGLEGVTVPATLAAISKAGSGAYLSSQGNAFSTRTASQIVQEHFNPGELMQPAGPLFGVQFSQLICSDANTINPALLMGARGAGKYEAAGLVGPRPLPLGLSADPGGIPIYKLGDVVGGIGVELDGAYTLDRDISNFDNNLEEQIALTATLGEFEIPSERDGTKIFVAGKTLRTKDIKYSALRLPTNIPSEVDSANLVPVKFYFDGTIKSGAIYGSAASGLTRTTRAGVPATFISDGAGNPRYPTIAGTAPGANKLTAPEVDAILDSALFTAFRTRAAIRTPRDSQAHVSIWVVDSLGVPLGMTRTADGPVFGIDVALQKARTAAFFSSKDVVSKLRVAGAGADYAGAVEAFFGTDVFQAGVAFSARAVGNISRPFFLDGIDGTAPGPFSVPFPGLFPSAQSWSPFNTGLQLGLVFSKLVTPILTGALSNNCSDSGIFGSRIRNGIQIFAGGVPLYKNGQLVGGIGISGDGIDQDDLIAFYGASKAGLSAVGFGGLGDSVYGFNAPASIRSDTLTVANARLRYVNCPEAPFVGSNDQKVCEGL